MILKLDITGNVIFFQVQKVFLTAVAAVSRYFLQDLPESAPMFFQYRDQGIVIRTVIAYIAMDNKIVFYRNLNIICRF